MRKSMTGRAFLRGAESFRAKLHPQDVTPAVKSAFLVAASVLAQHQDRKGILRAVSWVQAYLAEDEDVRVGRDDILEAVAALWGENDWNHLCISLKERGAQTPVPVEPVYPDPWMLLGTQYVGVPWIRVSVAASMDTADEAYARLTAASPPEVKWLRARTLNYGFTGDSKSACRDAEWGDSQVLAHERVAEYLHEAMGLPSFSRYDTLSISAGYDFHRMLTTIPPSVPPGRPMKVYGFYVPSRPQDQFLAAVAPHDMDMAACLGRAGIHVRVEGDVHGFGVTARAAPWKVPEEAVSVSIGANMSMQKQVNIILDRLLPAALVPVQIRHATDDEDSLVNEMDAVIRRMLGLTARETLSYGLPACMAAIHDDLGQIPKFKLLKVNIRARQSAPMVLAILPAACDVKSLLNGQGVEVCPEPRHPGR